MPRSFALTIAFSIFLALAAISSGPFAASAQAQPSRTELPEPTRFELDEPRPPGDVQTDVAETAEAIVEKSIEFRSSRQLNSLEIDQTLSDAARKFAEFMAQKDLYGHAADGRTFVDRAEAAGYDYAIVTENIAYRYRSTGYESKELAGKFVQAWIDSPEHLENLVDPDVTQIGVGVAQSETTRHYYAVQMFGRPASLTIRFMLSNGTDRTIRYQVGKDEFVLKQNFYRQHELGRPRPVTASLAEAKENDESTNESASADEDSADRRAPLEWKPEDGKKYRMTIDAEGKLRFDSTDLPAENSPADSTSPSIGSDSGQ